MPSQASATKASLSISQFPLLTVIPLSLYWIGLQFYLINREFLEALPPDTNNQFVYYSLIGAISGALLATIIIGLLQRHSVWFRTHDGYGLLGCICIACGSVILLCTNEQISLFTSAPFICIAPLTIIFGICLLLVSFVYMLSRYRLAWIIIQMLIAGFIGQIVLALLNRAPTTVAYLICSILLLMGGLWAHIYLDRTLRPRYSTEDVTSTNMLSLTNGTIPYIRWTRYFHFLRDNVGILFCSLTICMFLFFFTTGVTWSQIRISDVTSVNLISALFCLVTLIVTWCLGQKCPDHTIAFVMFKAAIPTLMCTALVMKIIQFDFTETVLFQNIMLISFQLCIPLGLSLVVYTIQHTERNDTRVLTGLIGLCVIFALIGLLISMLDINFCVAILGVVTAAALVCEVLLFGKEIVEYNKPVDIDPIRFSSVKDLDARCEEMSTRYNLTSRESEVLRELARGHSSGYIASAFCISTNTARSHMKNIYHKFGISSREELLDFLLAETPDDQP